LLTISASVALPMALYKCVYDYDYDYDYEKAFDRVDWRKMM